MLDDTGVAYHVPGLELNVQYDRDGSPIPGTRPPAAWCRFMFSVDVYGTLAGKAVNTVSTLTGGVCAGTSTYSCEEPSI